MLSILELQWGIFPTIFSKISFYLFEKQKEIERQTNPSSFPKFPQQPWLGQVEARKRKQSRLPTWVVGTQMLKHYLLSPMAQMSRKLKLEVQLRLELRHSNTGCVHLIWWLQNLCVKHLCPHIFLKPYC